MKVLVTGGTGFVGRAVLRELAVQGHTARLLVRAPRRTGQGGPGGELKGEKVGGDVLNRDSLPAAARGMDAIIHLVGIISEAGDATFARVHVEGSRNMSQAAAEAGVRRFVHMSALGTRPQAVSRYHQSKWAAEEIVRASGLDYTIFRPSLIYGREDQFVNFFATLARWSPVLPIMGEGKARLAPIAVEAVAKAFVGSLAEPRSLGKTFDLCGSERLVFREILEAILSASGRRRWCLRIPLPLARAQAALLELVFGRLLRRPPPLNRDQLIMLQEENIGDPQPAKALFQLPDQSFAEGIRSYLRPR